MKKEILIGLVGIGLAIACSNPEKKKVTQEEEKVTEEATQLSEEQKLVSEIEQVHQKSLYSSYEVVQFDLNLTFGGKERFNGRMYVSTNGGKVKMEDAQGLRYWDGNKAMVLPNEENNEKARFDLLTWSYFFTAAYKLNDPGTNHEYLGSKVLGDGEYNSTKLTFNDGVGDTPDDWYIIYQDKNSGLLAGMAYIVTSGDTDIEEAEKDPHVITYEAYTDVTGIPFATQWNFWTWNMEGEMNKLLGNASISNVELIKSAGDMFKLTPSSEDLVTM